MPRFILADYRVEFAHKFLKLMGIGIDMIPLNKIRKSNIDGKEVDVIKPNDVIHGECVEIYRLAIQDHIMPPAVRVGNWAQPYKDSEDIQRFIESQFKDVERIKSLIHGN